MMKNLDKKSCVWEVISANQLDDIFTQKSLEHLSIRKFNKTEVVLYDKEDFTVLSIVIEGKLKVVPSSMEGKSTLIDYIDKGAILGEIEYFGARQNIHTVVACEPTTLLDIPISIIEEELKHHAPFLLYVCNRLSDKLCSLSITHSKQLLMSTKVQLCRYIWETANRCECYSIPMKYMEIAQRLGKSDRHIRRVVKELVTEGIIIKEDRKFIRIVNVAELKAIINEK